MVCMALLVISLTETVLIVRLVHKQDLQTPVPDWVKYVVLERAPVLFCIHRKHRLCSRLSSQGSDLDRYKDSNYGTSKDAPTLGFLSLPSPRFTFMCLLPPQLSARSTTPVRLARGSASTSERAGCSDWACPPTGTPPRLS